MQFGKLRINYYLFSTNLLASKTYLHSEAMMNVHLNFEGVSNLKRLDYEKIFVEKTLLREASGLERGS